MFLISFFKEDKIMIKLFSPFSQNKKKPSSPNGIPFPKDFAGIGYIYIPPNVKRADFIKTCTNTSTVSVITEQGTVYNRVPIDKITINYIEWPTSIRTLGSPVVFINIPYHDKPVIISIYNALDEYSSLEEGQFNLEKITSGGHVKITGKGETGELFISVNSFDQAKSGLQDDLLKSAENINNTIKGGKIFIDVQNDSGTAEVNLNVKGDINFVTEGTTFIKNSKELLLEVRDEIDDPENLINFTTQISVQNGNFNFKIIQINADGSEVTEGATILNYTKGTGLSFTDEFNNQVITNKDEVIVNSKKFSLNSGAQAMVLGNILKTLLDDFITAVSEITTTTMLGAQPIINIEQVIALKERTEQILSKLGFLDNQDNRK